MPVRFLRLLALPLLFVLAPAPGLARTPDTVFLEELTSPEVREAIRAGHTTILVPIGGTEQSGPAIALGKHNARARALAARIAAELGKALVAPVLAYVPEGAVAPPTEHMRFAGTITVSDTVFEQLLESAAASFRQHGFRDVVLLGDHGGYQKSLAAVAQRLNRRWAGTPARVLAVPEYYRASQEGFAALLRQRGYRSDEIGTHAGLADAALTLALAPQLVREDRLREGAGRAEGVVGDPRRASAELGQAGADAIVAAAVAAIRAGIARGQAPHR